jgi:hypothetical protein
MAKHNLKVLEMKTTVVKPTDPISSIGHALNMLGHSRLEYGHVLTVSEKDVKFLLKQHKSENDVAKAACKGADAGGIDKPASGRILDKTSSQKSSVDPAQLQGGASCVRDGGPDVADATWAHGTHEGHNRTGHGHYPGRTIPHHSSSGRVKESAEKTARAIGKTNDWPRDHVRARKGDDAAFGGELVQDDLLLDQNAGLHLPFRAPHFHHVGRAQPVKGQRITEGCAGIGRAQRPQHDRAVHSRGSRSPAPTGQPNLTLLSVN